MIDAFNPLTANDELSRLENLTFLWTWILRWVPRSFATHASLCNTLSVSYTHLRAHETEADLVCRLLLEKKNYYNFLQTCFDICVETK